MTIKELVRDGIPEIVQECPYCDGQGYNAILRGGHHDYDYEQEPCEKCNTEGFTIWQNG